MSGYYPEGALWDPRNLDLDDFDDLDPDRLEDERIDALIDEADARRKEPW